MASCKPKNQLQFSGTVVAYELCTSHSDLGYAVQLSSPDTLGGKYVLDDSMQYDNVVVVYGADRQLHDGDRISGAFCLDNGYSKAYCSYHYRDTRGDVHEARLTKLKVNK